MYRALKLGIVVARAYAVDTGDRKRMRMLLDPIAGTEPEAKTITEPAATPPGEDKLANRRGHRVGMSEANMGQLNSTGKEALLEVLGMYNGKGLFLLNPKMVAVYNRPKSRLPRNVEMCTPV